MPIGLAVLVVVYAEADVVEKVLHRQRQVQERLSGVVYRASFVYREFDFKTGEVNSISGARRVEMRRYGDAQEDFLWVSVNGQALAGRQMERVCQGLIRKGLFARKTRMPFFPETQGEYRYEMCGEKYWEGESVSIVRFTPRKPDGVHISGVAYVRPSTGDVRHLEFVPAHLPVVVTDAMLTLDYDWVEGYLLPKRFRLRMDLRIDFIIEMMSRRIEIEEIYDDYRLQMRPRAEGDGG